MTDLKLKSDGINSTEIRSLVNEQTRDNQADFSESQLIPFAELLFFAYRDFVSDPDEILKDIGFGRAHHRVLHFVDRKPGLRVADLLKILKITKQSLARVLKQLVDEEYIRQETGQEDRRERHLYTTSKGQELARTLMEPQLRRIQNALQDIDTKDREHIVDFLYRMIEDQDETIAANHLNSIINQTSKKK